MPKICVLGSSTSHGGTIVTGDENVIVNGKPVARKGDLHACPIHGTNSIVSAVIDNIVIDGQPVACIGSVCGCGASVTSGEDPIVS